MTSCREEFAYTRCIEASLCKAEGRSETRSASTNDKGIILVVLKQSVVV